MREQIGNRPSLERLLTHLVTAWPEHTKYVNTALAQRDSRSLDVSEDISRLILQLFDNDENAIRALCDDYRFFCEKIILPEEVYFRRNERYRLSTFEEANREVYSNSAFMTRYMSGLLLSDVVFHPHAMAFSNFVLEYLPSLPVGGEHLEIGPGHGFFLLFAARRRQLKSVVGWDISDASISMTRHTLAKLGVGDEVSLVRRNLYEASTDEGRFDSVVLSEILEHLEDPRAALVAVKKLLRVGGRLWINVPANSPAPDHLFLLKTPEEAVELAKSAGFEVERSDFYPITGASLDKAKRNNLSINCVVAAKRTA